MNYSSMQDATPPNSAYFSSSAVVPPRQSEVLCGKGADK